MSSVTEIILLLGAYNEPDEDAAGNPLPIKAIAQLNEWLAENVSHGERCGFVALSPLVSEAAPYGFSTGIWATSANYLDKQEFLAAVRAAPWNDLDHVQVIIRHESQFIASVYGFRWGEINKME